MLNSIPQKRLVLYFILLGLIPLILSGFWLQQKISSLNYLKQNLELAQEKAISHEQRQAQNQAIITHFCGTDRFYLEKNVEPLRLLNQERESLQKIADDPHFAEDEMIKRRLEFLKGTSNTYAFAESAPQSLGKIKETIESLVHPVEIDLDDLKHLLSHIEGIPIGPYKPQDGRPQLIILDFKIDKKSLNEKQDVFQLQLKILKREFTSC